MGVYEDMGTAQATVGSMYAGINFWFTAIIAVTVGFFAVIAVISGLMKTISACQADVDCEQEVPGDTCVEGVCVASKAKKWGTIGFGLTVIIVLAVVVLLSWVLMKFVNTNRSTQQIGGAVFELGLLSRLFSWR